MTELGPAEHIGLIRALSDLGRPLEYMITRMSALDPKRTNV